MTLVTTPYNLGKSLAIAGWPVSGVLSALTNCTVLLHFAVYFLVLQLLFGRWYLSLPLAVLLLGAEIAAGAFLGGGMRLG